MTSAPSPVFIGAGDAGRAWLQALPFARLAGRIVGGFAEGQGEGSILVRPGRSFDRD